MMIAFACIAVGCAIGAFLTVWPIAIASAIALIVGLGAWLFGVATWSSVFSGLFFPVLMVQGGFLVALFTRAAVESFRPRERSHEEGVGGDAAKPTDIGGRWPLKLF